MANYEKWLKDEGKKLKIFVRGLTRESTACLSAGIPTKSAQSAFMTTEKPPKKPN